MHHKAQESGRETKAEKFRGLEITTHSRQPFR